MLVTVGVFDFVDMQAYDVQLFRSLKRCSIMRPIIIFRYKLCQLRAAATAYRADEYNIASFQSTLAGLFDKKRCDVPWVWESHSQAFNCLARNRVRRQAYRKLVLAFTSIGKEQFPSPPQAALDEWAGIQASHSGASCFLTQAISFFPLNARNIRALGGLLEILAPFTTYCDVPSDDTSWSRTPDVLCGFISHGFVKGLANKFESLSDHMLDTPFETVPPRHFNQATPETFMSMTVDCT